jgi:hypothetical protein
MTVILEKLEDTDNTIHNTVVITDGQKKIYKGELWGTIFELSFNPASGPWINIIADAFAEVEKEDVRVIRITSPNEYVVQLDSDTAIVSKICLECKSVYETKVIGTKVMLIHPENGCVWADVCGVHDS